MTKLTASHPKWQREEFIAFLLLYCANVDAEYSDEERQYIQSNIHADALRVVEAEFSVMSDYEHIQVIRSYEGSFYPSPDHKDEILAQVRGLFDSDGSFSIEESSLLMMLKKIL